MPDNDKTFNKWLKMSTENKINAKNTWEAPLIPYFVNLDNLKENKKTDFNRATTALNGCLKVYEERVNDVNDGAIKLANIINNKQKNKNENNTEQTKRNKKCNSFIVKDLQQINIRNVDGEVYYNSVLKSILNQNSGYFITENLNINKNGVILSDKAIQNELIVNDEEIEFDLKKYPLSVLDTVNPMNILNSEKKVVLLEPSEIPVIEDVINVTNEKVESYCEISNVYDENINNSVISDVQLSNTQIKSCSNPKFVDFKNWRTEFLQEEPKRKKKYEKDKFYIDFKAEINTDILYSKMNTTQSKDDFYASKRQKMVLPAEHTYDLKDLYRYLIDKNNYFKPANIRKEDSFTNTNNDISFVNSENVSNVFDMTQKDINLNDNADSFENLETNNVKEESNEFNLATLYRRIAKKVDMKKLKTNISLIIKNRETIDTLNKLYNVLEEMYENKIEFKDISKHFTFIGLLHVATEENMHLENINTEDVKIIR